MLLTFQHFAFYTYSEKTFRRPAIMVVESNKKTRTICNLRQQQHRSGLFLSIGNVTQTQSLHTWEAFIVGPTATQGTPPTPALVRHSLPKGVSCGPSRWRNEDNKYYTMSYSSSGAGIA